MADIVLKCPDCGETTAVSEYVDIDAVACRGCGLKLEVPRVAVSTRPRQAPKQKRITIPKAEAAQDPRKEKSSPLPAQRETMTAYRAARIRERQRRHQRRFNIAAFIPSMRVILVLFLLVTGALTFLRYGPVFSDSDKDAYKLIGMICLGVGWLAVTVDAFNDNAMYGLLCLFIPPYCLGYLYTKCDSLLLRVGVGVFVLPFSLDALVFIWRSLGVCIQFLSGSEILNEGF